MDMYSECCGAKPLWDVEDYDGELYGVCSTCGENALFFDDDDYIDWADEVEYISEHME